MGPSEMPCIPCPAMIRLFIAFEGDDWETVRCQRTKSTPYSRVSLIHADKIFEQLDDCVDPPLID
jgi:hypothetical protein